jgi:elongation factor P hydroxylase
MVAGFTDDECCQFLINAFRIIFPTLTIKGGAEEPFYEAPTENGNAVLYFRDNYPRSLLHEISHYCLAGDRRRGLDDFDYWYSPCGRSEEEQLKFEAVEARPQGLEKAICEVLDIKFSPSLDDFSGRPPSDQFLVDLEKSYNEMCSNPPITAQKLLSGLKGYRYLRNTTCVGE